VLLYARALRRESLPAVGEPAGVESQTAGN
jgi:hypothetical protein